MKTLTLDERGRQIQAKIKAGTRAPEAVLMMNSGRRRTQAKRDLLASIKQRYHELGKKNGFEAKF